MLSEREVKKRIGERIKGARTMSQLSQRELAKNLNVSAMAVSKYERGLIMPNSQMLIKLSGSLDVGTDFFLREGKVDIGQPMFREKCGLKKKEEKASLSKIADWLERYKEVETLLGEEKKTSFDNMFPKKILTSAEQTEEFALELRERWKLGSGKIENFTEFLEENGLKVSLIDANESFVACTFTTNEAWPVIAINKKFPGDRYRFCLAHELGHILIDVEKNDMEKTIDRFAGAFLVTKEAAMEELGETRNCLDFFELHLLKHKYGLSMAGWIHRAEDLGIIKKSLAQQFRKFFKERGWDKKEPGDDFPLEEPRRFQRLILKALSEEIITESRAAELLGEPWLEFYEREMRGTHRWNEYAGGAVEMRH